MLAHCWFKTKKWEWTPQLYVAEQWDGIAA